MNMFFDKTRGLGLLLALNADRILYLCAIAAAMSAGAWIAILV
jgi:hypothetical protein